jgi:hypothetical protein
VAPSFTPVRSLRSRARLADLLGELKRRRVIRALIAYAVVSKALEAKKLQEVFQGTYLEQQRTIALTVGQLWEQYEPITKRDNELPVGPGTRSAHPPSPGRSGGDEGSAVPTSRGTERSGSGRTRVARSRRRTRR